MMKSASVNYFIFKMKHSLFDKAIELIREAFKASLLTSFFSLMAPPEAVCGGQENELSRDAVISCEFVRGQS